VSDQITINEIEQRADELRFAVANRIDEHAMGDRPPSPPAWLLKLRSDLEDALDSMRESSSRTAT
jgi:hypothetical protein